MATGKLKIDDVKVYEGKSSEKWDSFIYGFLLGMALSLAVMVVVLLLAT